MEQGEVFLEDTQAACQIGIKDFALVLNLERGIQEKELKGSA